MCVCVCVLSSTWLHDRSWVRTCPPLYPLMPLQSQVERYPSRRLPQLILSTELLAQEEEALRRREWQRRKAQRAKDRAFRLAQEEKRKVAEQRARALRAALKLRDDSDDEQEPSPLQVAFTQACEQGDLESAQAAFSEGLKQGPGLGVDPCQRLGGVTPLFLAARRGSVETVKWLCEDLAVVPHGRISRRFNRMAPLHVAASKGHLEVVACLLGISVSTDVFTLPIREPTPGVYKRGPFVVHQRGVPEKPSKPFSIMKKRDQSALQGTFRRQLQARLEQRDGSTMEHAAEMQTLEGLRPLHLAALVARSCS